MSRIIVALFLWLLTAPSWAKAELIVQPIGQFSAGTLHGWQEKKFKGFTQYDFVFDDNIQKKVLKATSQAGASGLFFESKIDLAATPWLNWSWRTDSLLKGINENEKNGDDFTARIYVVIDGGFFFWKTLALNYVWSSSHQQGEKWDNPYTANATMFAVASGAQELGRWQQYKRNVRDDLRTLVGKDMRYIDAIAIMTDTDNSGLQATTYFGDITFTSD